MTTKQNPRRRQVYHPDSQPKARAKRLPRYMRTNVLPDGRMAWDAHDEEWKREQARRQDTLFDLTQYRIETPTTSNEHSTHPIDPANCTTGGVQKSTTSTPT